jgi:hypothetical protein
MASGRRWAVEDRLGNRVYLTEERWEHIVEGHPEILRCEAELQQTLRSAARRQDAINPQKFRYTRKFPGLPGSHTHLEAVVLFRFEEVDAGLLAANNYVVTAYLKRLGDWP